MPQLTKDEILARNPQLSAERIRLYEEALRRRKVPPAVFDVAAPLASPEPTAQLRTLISYSQVRRR
jgi:hypothetical protein